MGILWHTCLAPQRPISKGLSDKRLVAPTFEHLIIVLASRGFGTATSLFIWRHHLQSHFATRGQSMPHAPREASWLTNENVTTPCPCHCVPMRVPHPAMYRRVENDYYSLQDAATRASNTDQGQKRAFYGTGQHKHVALAAHKRVLHSPACWPSRRWVEATDEPPNRPRFAEPKPSSRHPVPVLQRHARRCKNKTRGLHDESWSH